MRKRIGWLGFLAGLLLASGSARAQDPATFNYAVPPVDFTGPLSHPRYEDGGFFIGSEFMYYKTNRTMYTQTVASRGFLDNDGSITGTPNTFVGTKQEALNVNQLQGPGTWQPGYDLYMGWRFQSGVVVELDWKHLIEAQYNASASILPPGFNVGNQLQNTFLFSPVSNFPQDFAGPAQKLAVGQPGAVYGIWNGASLMNINLTQRFDIYQMNVRVPIWQGENYRSYGLFGPRVAWIWDQFTWRTVDIDVNGNSSPDNAALYHNMVSNRMYGVHFGFGNEWYLGSTGLGTISIFVDGEASIYADMVKTNVDYTRVDNAFTESRGRHLTSLVPGIEGRIGFNWYIWEGITIHLNYDAMAFFNTIGSPKPIDFNMGTLDPTFQSEFRWFYGMQFGISFVF